MWQSFLFWETVLDIISLCLCGMAVITLIRWKYSERKKDPVEGTETGAAISQTAGKDTPCGSLPDISDRFQTILDEKTEKQIRSENNTEEDPYAAVKKLAVLGMTAEQIARQVNIPKGEIDLLVRLKKHKL
ncbi:MAG: hypothetical protein V2I97_07280 [Desulfococcaceae bacterium]|jgi:hypothetical protein|nr:hypothetical protein [Desulfococcaceae bacterium]